MARRQQAAQIGELCITARPGSSIEHSQPFPAAVAAAPLSQSAVI
jgi:hypothetical protein